ncbi:hypothetical protein QBC39DRAFT_254038 [Podospora conica]|nr:hypothetical protein QBC39DRAFT_254038 [Schizothecium conicum]
MSSPKIVLVTGANKGIGYEIVKALLASPQPYHVLLGSRSLDRGNDAAAQLRSELPSTTNTVEPLELDLVSDTSIQSAFTTVKSAHGRLDVLINNAGLTRDPDYLRGTATLRASLTDSYAVNVAGTHVVSSTFVPLLLLSADPRLIFISGLGTFASATQRRYPLPTTLERGTWPKSEVTFETVGYRCSKTALNMLMLDYRWKLEGDGVKVWAVMPGFLETDFGGGRELVKEMGAGHPSLGGELVRRVVEGERDGEAGMLIDKDGVVEF